MSEELKSCPFCGEVPTLTYGPKDAFMSHQCTDATDTFCMTVEQWNSRANDESDICDNLADGAAEDYQRDLLEGD